MCASVVPVNVQVPAEATAPVVADLPGHAIRMAHIWRRDLDRLPANDWNAPGIYVLLGGGIPPETHVGKAVELRGRLFQHRSKPKLDWIRAITIKRDVSHGFNSAEIGYLEGRVASELRAIPGLNVVEGLQNQDETLPPHLLLTLDEFVPSILSGLRVFGVDLYKPSEEAGLEKSSGEAFKKTHTIESGTIADLVAAGLLSAGAELHLSQGGVTARASVTAAGQILVDGVAFSSPSPGPPAPLGSNPPTAGRRGTSAPSPVQPWTTSSPNWPRMRERQCRLTNSR